MIAIPSSNLCFAFLQQLHFVPSQLDFRSYRSSHLLPRHWRDRNIFAQLGTRTCISKISNWNRICAQKSLAHRSRRSGHLYSYPRSAEKSRTINWAAANQERKKACQDEEKVMKDALEFFKNCPKTLWRMKECYHLFSWNWKTIF